MNENFYFFIPAYFPIFHFPFFRFPADQKILHNLKIFEVEKNFFLNENFHLFTPTYFPIFQNSRPKNLKKGTFYISRRFSRLRKTFPWMKIYIFSPQHIFKFYKMADQKPWNRHFLYYPWIFDIEKNVFLNENFHFFTPTNFPIFQINESKKLKKGTFYITREFSRFKKRLSE